MVFKILFAPVRFPFEMTDSGHFRQEYLILAESPLTFF